METAPKGFCFILMPFHESFDDICELGIKSACREASAYCERVDEQIYQGTTLERVYNQIDKADLIVADMTGRNANVFYEVGYAHALGKPTILITQREGDIPFDLKHFPHIIYGNKISSLKVELTQRVKWFLENRIEYAGCSTIEIELFVGMQSLSKGDVSLQYDYNEFPEVNLTIQNKSSHVYKPGELKLGVVTSRKFHYCDPRQKTIQLPDGGFFHVLPNFDAIFPMDYEGCRFELEYDCESYESIDNETESIADSVIVRLLTDFGSRDYPLRIVRKPKDRD